MSDNFLDEVYDGPVGIFEDMDTDADTTTPEDNDPELIYAHNSLLGDKVEVFGMAPNGYCIYITVNGGTDARIPVRGRLPELIRALQAEYERVTGERI